MFKVIFFLYFINLQTRIQISIKNRQMQLTKIKHYHFIEVLLEEFYTLPELTMNVNQHHFHW